MNDIDIKIKKLKSRNDVTRNEIQELAVELSTVHDNLFLNFCTRLGKSLTILKICKYHNYEKVLMVSSQDIHINNFKLDAKKHGYDISNFTLICWNSYDKYKDNVYDCVICDEVDFSLQNHIKFLVNTKPKHFILLSATITWEQESLLKSKLNYYKWKIDLSDAITWGILPLPKVYLKPIKLNKTQQIELDKIQSTLNYYKDKCDNEVGWTKKVKLTDNELNDLMFEKGRDNEQFEKEVEQYPTILEKTVDTWEAIKVKMAGGQRKKFFEKIKKNWFEKEKIFERLKDKRTIFFLPDIKYSQKLGNSVSSLESSKQNGKILDDFNNGDINYLISNKIMVRGVNLYNINFGYFGIIDMNGTSLSQSFGRVLLGISPNIVAPYVVGTKEEKVLMGFIKKLNCEIHNF